MMTTEDRLGRVERELAAANRRNRWLLAVVALVLVGLGLAWALTEITVTAEAQGAAREVHANKFTLVDENGKIRAVLGVSEDGWSMLGLYDENGKMIRASLSVSNAGSMLGLYDENGKMIRASLSMTKYGPRLDLYDANGKTIWSAP